MKEAILTGLISMIISAGTVILITLYKNEKIRPKDETKRDSNFDITTDL